MAAHDAQFVEFVQRSSADLLRFAWGVTGRRETAEDLVQDALQRVYVKWRSIDDSPMAYARKAIVNRHLDQVRRHKLIRFLPLPQGLANTPAPTEAPDLRLDVLAALERLPARERTAVALRYICDLPEREVADLLDVSVGTVKASASRGVAKLRGALIDRERV
ncbi:SigE family RNA polymerase sigma factor [Intrasporangium mesophilum]